MSSIEQKDAVTATATKPSTAGRKRTYKKVTTPLQRVASDSFGLRMIGTEQVGNEAQPAERELSAIAEEKESTPGQGGLEVVEANFEPQETTMIVTTGAAETRQETDQSFSEHQ